MLFTAIALITGTIFVIVLTVYIAKNYIDNSNKVLQPNGEPVPEGPPIDFRSDEERKKAQEFQKELWSSEYHIDEAVELGQECGLSKRRSRALIDAWTEVGEVADEYRNEPGPGRPRRFIGGVGPGED